MTRINKLDSVQIQLCRVICIFFMMSAHITPGPLEASAVMTGDFSVIGEVWIQWLGRSSVATLSLVSGYLMWHTSRDTPIKDVAVSKFRTLIIPMAFWNAVFILLLIEKGGPEGAGFAVSADTSLMHWIDGLFGLTDSTANRALFFLRDLFVSLVLIRVGIDLIARNPVPAIILAFIAAAFGLLEPLIFRPSIVLFAITGVIIASQGVSLQKLSSPRFILPAIAALTIPYLILAHRIDEIPIMANGDHYVDILFLLRRAILICITLGLTGLIARATWSNHIAKHAGQIFEAYLIHRIVISAVWIAWVAAVGTATDNSYVLFFVLAPFLAILTGERLGRLVNRLPAAVQILIRGKSVSRAQSETNRPLYGG